MAITGAISHRFLAIARFTLLLSHGLSARKVPIFIGARRAVSSAVTRKPGTKAATIKTAIKPTTKKTVTKGAAIATTTKRTTAAKGTATKKPTSKKKITLTDDQKKRKLIRELKVKALDPPSKGHTSGYVMWFMEQPKDTYKIGTSEMGRGWKALTKEEKDSYTNKAKEQQKRVQEEYKKWINSQPALVIREANNARRRLKALGVKHGVTQIIDGRLPKRITAPSMMYAREQYQSGRDFRDADGKTSVIKTSAILRDEYAKLPASEKKRFEDMVVENKKKYDTEMAKLQKQR